MAAAQIVKSRLLLNIVLLLALAGLGLYAYLRPGEEAATAIPISQLKPDEISHITVKRTNQFDVELERRGQTWFMVRPYSTRVNTMQVEPLLELAKATASNQLPASDLTRYGLDPAPVTVRLNNQLIAFGTINEITNEQYLGTNDAVFMVRTYHGYNVPYDLDKLISEKLLGPEEEPVGFDFGDWRATRSEKGSWSLQGKMPEGEELAPSPDALNVWVAEWKLASALSAKPNAEPPRGDTVIVRFAGGGETTFRVLSTQPGVRLLRTDENIVYQLGEDAGGRLLDPYRVAGTIQE